MDLRRACETVVAVTVTPFDDDGELDARAYSAVVRRAVAAGVTVVTANGNTGEFYALAPSEVDRAVDLTVEAAGPALVVAGVGHDVQRAVSAAKAAAAAGAGAVMVHQPLHPHQSVEGWLAYHRAIADAVPDLGLLCYVRDPRVDGARIAQLAEACPTLVGIKYAVPDVQAFARAVATVPPERLAWICGLAELWAPYFWLAGARGFTSGLAVVAPGVSLALLERMRAADLITAMGVWEVVRPIEEMRARDGGAMNVAVIKEALAQLGLCRPSVRLPGTQLSEADRAEVAAITAGWDRLRVSRGVSQPA
ncbi:MAG: dihydrodipicolinate synthase family protein [Hamadaea sp.]|nr:dihydrodipicolinate synthase family protein [Hamadaea sp.]